MQPGPGGAFAKWADGEIEFVENQIADTEPFEPGAYSRELGLGGRGLFGIVPELVEQLDDFASPPYDVDEGRHTEGYRYLHTLSGTFEYRGNTLVIDSATHRALIRAEWRALLGTLSVGGLSNYTFAYNLTDTNAIPQSEFLAWSAKVSAAGKAFETAFSEFSAAAARLHDA